MYSNGGIYIPDRKPPLGAVRNPYLAINRGLVLDAMMSEGAGNTVADLSGNGNIGTLVDGAHWVAGKFGSCLEFDGDGDSVTIPDSSSLDVSTAVTISCRFKTSIGDSRLLHKNASFYVEVRFGGNLRIYTAGLSDTTMDGSGGVTDGIWHNVAFTYDGAKKTIYIDGVFDASEAATGSITNTVNPVLIAINHVGTSDFTGPIDLPMIYNRDLSASEIQQLYREPFCGYRWESIIELASYVAGGGESSVAKIMQQMNQFNGGQAA